jgi:uncharacterized protein
MSLTSELETQVAAAVLRVMSADDTAHSIEHADEVWRLSKWLLAGTQARPRICLAAAYCHDLRSRGEAGFTNAVDSSVKHGSSLLSSLGYNDEEIALIGTVITEASWENFVKGLRPSSLEAQILRDADWLDATGAHGVARVFAFAGRYCLPLTFVDQDADHPVALPTPAHAPDPPFHHFYSKLLWLRENFITEKARAEGERRHAFLVSFLKEYRRELTFRVDGAPEGIGEGV